MADTWASRDLPLLKVIVEAFEENPNGDVRLEQLQKSTGLSAEELTRAMAALARAQPPFFGGTMVSGLAYPVIISQVTERALIVTDQWPSPESSVQQLIEALGRAAETETDPDRKSKLQQTAQVIGGVALQIFTGWASGALPHP
jgi:hypothetical protein